MRMTFIHKNKSTASSLLSSFAFFANFDAWFTDILFTAIAFRHAIPAKLLTAAANFKNNINTNFAPITQHRMTILTGARCCAFHTENSIAACAFGRTAIVVFSRAN